MSDLDLAAFLRARLDEDEAGARAAGAASWHQSDPDRAPGFILDDTDSIDNIVVYDEGAPSGAQAAHIARHDPARALREVATKRKLIASALRNAADVDGEWGDGHDAEEIASGQCGDHGTEALAAILGPLAAVWSDHPDYRQEWAL